MKPTTFPQQNGTLGGGPAARYGTDDDVADLPVHRGAGQVISCWQLSWRDLFTVLRHRRIWFIALGNNHAPVCLQVEKPFEPVKP